MSLANTAGAQLAQEDGFLPLQLFHSSDDCAPKHNRPLQPTDFLFFFSRCSLASSSMPHFNTTSGFFTDLVLHTFNV